MSVVMTPFTWSMMRMAFDELNVLPGHSSVGNIGGRLYQNVTVGVSVLRVLGKNIKDMAKETGGRVWRATAPRELREKFLEILSQLQNRYVLRFTPQGGARPGWHELEVRLKGRKGKIRARRGYFR